MVIGYAAVARSFTWGLETRLKYSFSLWPTRLDLTIASFPDLLTVQFLIASNTTSNQMDSGKA